MKLARFQETSPFLKRSSLDLLQRNLCTGIPRQRTPGKERALGANTHLYLSRMIVVTQSRHLLEPVLSLPEWPQPYPNGCSGIQELGRISSHPSLPSSEPSRRDQHGCALRPCFSSHSIEGREAAITILLLFILPQ